MIAPLALFALALAGRLLFLVGAPGRSWPHSVWYEGDAPLWVHWAGALHEGQVFEHGLAVHSPAVAYVLAALRPLLPAAGWFLGAKVGWCVLSALGVLLAYFCVRREFGMRVGLIAAGLYAFSFGSYVTAASLNNEAMYTPLLLASIWLLLRAGARPTWTMLFMLGLIHGLALLVRAEHLLFLAISLTYLAWGWMRHGRGAGFERVGVRTLDARRPAGAAIRLLVMLVVAVGVCLPWSIRASRAAAVMNARLVKAPRFDPPPVWTPDARAMIESLPAFAQAGNAGFCAATARQRGVNTVDREFVEEFFEREFNGYVPDPMTEFFFVSSQGPLSFALANHPAADGGFSRAALVGDGRMGPDPQLEFSFPPHLALFNHGYAIGWGYIRADVGKWLELAGRKLRRFGAGVTLGYTAYNVPYGRGGVRQPVDLLTPPPGARIAWQVAFWVLFGTGVVIALRRRSGGVWMLVIAYKLVVTILFYGYARQAVSILPAFLVFVALAADWLYAAAAARLRLRPVAGWALVAVLAAGGLGADISSAIREPRLRVSGPARPAPQWGPQAFEAVDRIEVRME